MEDIIGFHKQVESEMNDIESLKKIVVKHLKETNLAKKTEITARATEKKANDFVEYMEEILKATIAARDNAKSEAELVTEALKIAEKQTAIEKMKLQYVTDRLRRFVHNEAYRKVFIEIEEMAKV
jgi:hypothetical protein